MIYLEVVHTIQMLHIFLISKTSTTTGLANLFSHTCASGGAYDNFDVHKKLKFYDHH